MQARELERLDKRLEGFLTKLTAGMGRSERRRWAGVYVRGLLLDGERKSVEPMASRLGQSDQDLHHFVSHSPWSADLLLKGLTKTTVAAAPAYWIIDETSFPKAGSHSAGVQRQSCGALGKKANCQLAVSLHRADEAAGKIQPLSWRLFLPASWTDDPARCQRVGIPSGMVHQSKLDLALELIDQTLGWELPAGVVLADEAYGGSFEWRLALSERHLFYGVRVPWTTTGWQEEPRFGPPEPVRRGRPPCVDHCSARSRKTCRHRAGSARFGVEDGHLEARQQGAATFALCQPAAVGGTRLETGSAARARRGKRAHREAGGRSRPHALLARAAAKEKGGLGQTRRHRQGALARGAGLPRTQGRTRPRPF